MRVEVLGGVERRRRRWSSDEKMRILEETLVPGAKVSEVARRNGISASLVFTWRRQARTGKSLAAIAPRFAAVRIAGPDTGAEISNPSSEELTQSRPAASTLRLSEAQGRRRETESEGSVEQSRGPMDKNHGKAVDLTSKDLRRVRATGLSGPQGP